MPPSDQEPRYRLVDSNGNVVGSLFGDGSGNVVIADETDTQTTFGPNGITTPALEATDSINAANLSGATQDDVLKKAASGNDLTFGQVQTEPNVPDWIEDANSPHNLSTDGHEYILSGEYDLVKVFMTSTDPSTVNRVEMQINGLTGFDYNYYEEDGTTNTDNNISIVVGLSFADAIIDMTGRWGSDGEFGANIDLLSFTNRQATAGNHETATSPLTKFSFINSGDPLTADIDIEVYGRDVA